MQKKKILLILPSLTGKDPSLFVIPVFIRFFLCNFLFQYQLRSVSLYLGNKFMIFMFCFINIDISSFIQVFAETCRKVLQL